jgi:hypothetical protein
VFFSCLFPNKFLFYNYLYVHIIWISTIPYIKHMEGINSYVNKYAYKYTSICRCDSLIIVKFGSLLFGKIGCFMRFVAYPITKTMFHSQDQTSQLNCKLHYEYTTAKLVLSWLFRYKKKKTLLTSLPPMTGFFGQCKIYS